MAPSPIKKAIGVVKDQTSIGLAKISCTTSPKMEVAIVRATSHGADPPDERQIREILALSSCSLSYVAACISAVSRRMAKTRDWIVALKALILIHRLVTDADPSFHNEIISSSRRETRLLGLSDFRDEAHSSSWFHSAFVRSYAIYLDNRLEHSLDARSLEKSTKATDNLQTKQVLERMTQLQRLLDQLLACRPTGLAASCRMVKIAIYLIVKENFELHREICEMLEVILDRFFDMNHSDCLKAFDAYARAAKQMEELAAFYGWCKEAGVARPSDFPEVLRISSKLLQALEAFTRDRTARPKILEKERVLPATGEHEAAATKPPEKAAADLLDLNDVSNGKDDQENPLALVLISPVGQGANGPESKSENSNWEISLVDNPSGLLNQETPPMAAGDLDLLMLNEPHDRASVNLHSNGESMANSGAVSSVEKRNQLVALRAAEGEDPFAASLSAPLPPHFQVESAPENHQPPDVSAPSSGLDPFAELVSVGRSFHEQVAAAAKAQHPPEQEVAAPSLSVYTSSQNPFAVPPAAYPAPSYLQVGLMATEQQQVHLVAGHGYYPPF